MLFCKYMRGSTVAVNVRCGEYEGPTEPQWIRGTIETPWLDVSAAISDDGMVSLVVVNVHETKGFATKLDGIAKADVKVYTVTGSNVQVTNMDKEQTVSIKESDWDGKGSFTFPKHSMTMLRWKA